MTFQEKSETKTTENAASEGIIGECESQEGHWKVPCDDLNDAVYGVGQSWDISGHIEGASQSDVNINNYLSGGEESVTSREESELNFEEYEKAVLAILEDEENKETAIVILEQASSYGGDEESVDEAGKTLTEAEITALEEDLDIYNLTITSSLKEEWRVCPDAELDVLMLEHFENVNMMRKRIKKEKVKLEMMHEGEMRSDSEMVVSFTELSIVTDMMKTAKIIHQY